MDLPILQSSAIPPSTVDLLRHAHKLLREWSSAVGEVEEIDAGVAIINPATPDVAEANALLDAIIHRDQSAEDVVAAVDAHFAARSSSCKRWVFNPSIEPEISSPVTDVLTANGFVRRTTPILYAPLGSLWSSAATLSQNVMILPSRAAYTAYSRFAEQIATSPQHASAMVAHLDDPRYDAMLAMRDSQTIAHAGVLAVGDMGLLAGFSSTEEIQDSSLADVLLDRAIDYCRRSQFKHVFATGESDISRLIDRGFTVVGDYIEFVRTNG